MTRGSRHRKTPPPSARDIDELLAFLPRLTVEGFTPIRRWGGGEKTEDGGFVMPWPVYDEDVEAFFDVAGQDCWMDFEYVPVESGRMLEDEAWVRRASLDEIKTMLTYCVRGERFSEGHWGAMIEGGHVRRLLERLADIQSTGSGVDPRRPARSGREDSSASQPRSVRLDTRRSMRASSGSSPRIR